MVLNGCCVFVLKNWPSSPTRAIGVKSATGSYGAFLNSDGTDECVVLPPDQERVSVGCCARDVARAESWRRRPALFSTTNGCPKASFR